MEPYTQRQMLTGNFLCACGGAKSLLCLIPANIHSRTEALVVPIVQRRKLRLTEPKELTQHHRVALEFQPRQSGSRGHLDSRLTWLPSLLATSKGRLRGCITSSRCLCGRRFRAHWPYPVSRTSQGIAPLFCQWVFPKLQKQLSSPAGAARK